ncbi:MAG: hypothetical protein OXG13_22965 [Gemmatimonadaceae bacterium]|nr:hypothetical protein [Gemmatimonadaceae bacterium]
MVRLAMAILLSGSAALAAPGPGPHPPGRGPWQVGSMALPGLWAGPPPGAVPRLQSGLFGARLGTGPMAWPLLAGERLLQQRARTNPPQTTETIWRPALVATAALAVTGAAVAWWSTGEADAAYDRYLRSAGSQRQQRAFERAERYDRIAGAAFLAMEAGVVLTACLVFF